MRYKITAQGNSLKAILKAIKKIKGASVDMNLRIACIPDIVWRPEDYAFLERFVKKVDFKK